MIFLCTNKARLRLRISPSELETPPSSPSPSLTEWHCNLLTLGRRPFFLFVHSQSLFGVFVPAAGNISSGAVGEAFRHHALKVLCGEGYAPNQIGKVVDASPDWFCRATDRRILGSMVDFAYMSGAAAEGLGPVDAQLAYDQIHEAPMSVLGMKSSRVVLRDLLAPGRARPAW
jgi:hypothetical protein